MKCIYEIKYVQKFGKNKDWIEFSDTIVGNDHMNESLFKKRKIALEKTMDGKSCSGFRIISIIRMKRGVI